MGRKRLSLPDYYSAAQPCRAGEEHPVDVLIGEVPEIVSRRRKLLGMAKKVQGQACDKLLFIRYVDGMSEYAARREQLYFNAGFERGLLAGHADSRAAGAAARALSRQVALLVAACETPLPEAVAALLGVARGMVLGLARRGKRK